MGLQLALVALVPLQPIVKLPQEPKRAPDDFVHPRCRVYERHFARAGTLHGEGSERETAGLGDLWIYGKRGYTLCPDDTCLSVSLEIGQRKTSLVVTRHPALDL